jgi:hypothetical protein
MSEERGAAAWRLARLHVVAEKADALLNAV